MLSSTLTAVLASLSALASAAPTAGVNYDWEQVSRGGTRRHLKAADTTNLLISPDPLIVFDNGVTFSYTPDGAITMRLPDGTIDWTTGTTDHDCGMDRCALQFQGDGNLAAVDYNTIDAWYWATGTTSDNGKPGKNAYIYDSKPYIVVYAEDDTPIWSSGD